MRTFQKLVTLAGTAVMCTVLAATLAAQQDQPSPKPSDPNQAQSQGDADRQNGAGDKRDENRDRMQAEQTSITGCLNKDSAGAYQITDEATGVKTTVSGTADLEKHAANHKVKLTGALHTDNAGNSIFQVTKLDHISASCTAGSK